MKLRDKSAIITGAGSGIGRSSALLFAREGARIVAADIDSVGGQETVRQIKDLGGEAVFIKTDVSKAAEVKEMIDMSMQQFGRLDILFNNAGSAQPYRFIEDLDEETYDRIFNINVKSVFLGSRMAIPIFKQQKSGVIINTSSLSGIRQLGGMSLYSASKSAVVGLTKAMALELAPFHVRCNCICPAPVDTPMFQASMGEKEKQMMVSRVPMGRMVTPEEVAASALFLASDDSSMTTGLALTIDGGRGI